MTDIDITQFPNTVEAFDGSEQRAIAFLDRYAMKDAKGEPVETYPGQMWGRVAWGIAGLDDTPEGSVPGPLMTRFHNLLTGFKFVPGGRILAGAGTRTEVTFYNCYVIPVETKARRYNRQHPSYPYQTEPQQDDAGSDSREAIIDTIGVMVDIMSRGGGVGINWSVLRPRGAHLKTINATSSGPIDWMHAASVMVGTVEQGGSRRGAAMFMLDDWHPDLLEFIDAKRNESLITNANVSVAVSDRFMSAVDADAPWELLFPDTTHHAYDAEWDGDLDAWDAKGYPVLTYATVPARELWRKLAEAAHASGEPGVVFLERYNKRSTAQGVERIISVNPCGEQGLGPYSVCNLGAMNLARYVVDYTGGDSPHFYWSRFIEDVGTAVEFLDRVVDENFYFLPENEKVQKDLRRIGLGVMGLADALIMLGIRYGSPEAVRFTEDVFREMKHAALRKSAELAKELGPAPAWRDSMLAQPYLDDLHMEEGGGDVFEFVSEHGLRNLFLLTQAPTGTTSTLAGVNSGIEPLFALEYTRKDRTGTHKVVAPAIQWYVRNHGEPEERGIWPDYIVTASEVTVEEHIAMQAAVQKYVDSSVSKTINAPNSQTVEEVEKAYTLAYKSGLKGLAYYRDGSRQEQVLRRDEPGTVSPDDSTVEDLTGEMDASKWAAAFKRLNPSADEGLMLGWFANAIMAGFDTAERRADRPFDRPDALTGRTHKVRSGTHTAYVTVNRGDENDAVEVFVSVGKSGTSMMEMGEAMGRLASIGLQRGLTLLDIIDQLDGVGNNGPLARSLPSAIAEALKADIAAEAEAHSTVNAFYGEVAKVALESAWGTETEEWESVKPAGDLCPDCGQMTLVREEGCSKCHVCGYSAC